MAVLNGSAVPHVTRMGRRVVGTARQVVAGLAVLGALAALTAAIGSRVGSINQYTVFGHPGLIVVSGSMTPTIDTGDLIVDDPARGDTHLRAGQIVSFYDSPPATTILSHRIVQVIRRGGLVFYRTKGDANSAPDPALRPAADVIGVFRFRIPRAGFFLVNIHTPPVLGLLLASPLLWLASSALRSLARSIDAEAGGSRAEGDGHMTE